APMLFTTAGLLLSLISFGSIHNGITAPWIKTIAEITLILVLFTDASTIHIPTLLKGSNLPLRLLFIGLPVTMIIGILIAYALFPNENKWVMALTALILSPTDAALGVAVVTGNQIPLRIRQTINAESGLNDGLTLPAVLACMAFLNGSSSVSGEWHIWLIFMVKQFVFGPLVGALVGWLGGFLTDKASEREWMSSTFQRISSIVLAITAYYLAEWIHGNGFIAAFFSGLLLGTRNRTVRERQHAFGEADSQILVLFIFLLLGLIMIPESLPHWNLEVFLYALLNLTVIRVIPAMISLWGTGLSMQDKFFISWFGPKGIASLLFTLMLVVDLGKTNHETLISIVSLTVLLSIFLHGISAHMLSKLYRNHHHAHGNN
ncbi:MAG TPA: cation:proton antiporter, partial [Bacteroidia bacterium]|nr:cation:proton antiporter [Bacteroidia bacterium]